MDEIVGPARLPCSRQCEIPEGLTLAPVPTPRHAWGDVLVCPYEDCRRAWLVVADTVPPAPVESPDAC